MLRNCEVLLVSLSGLRDEKGWGRRDELGERGGALELRMSNVSAMGNKDSGVINGIGGVYDSCGQEEQLIHPPPFGVLGEEASNSTKEVNSRSYQSNTVYLRLWLSIFFSLQLRRALPISP